MKSCPTTSYSPIKSITNKNDLTSQEICEIIKTCSEGNVNHFSYSGLEISFKGFVAPNPTICDNIIGGEETLLGQTELDWKDEELVEMKITDPFQYEQLLAERELE